MGRTSGWDEITDEEIVAFVDGELAAEDAEAVARRLAADPSAQARANDLRSIRGMARAALSEDFDAPLPADLIRRIREAPLPEPGPAEPGLGEWIGSFRRGLRSLLGWVSLRPRMAVGSVFALPLVIVLVAIPTFRSAPDRIDTVAGVGVAIPEGSALATLLSETPSVLSVALPDGGDTFNPVLSFRDIDGNWCREYEVFAADGEGAGVTAVACRADGVWRNRILVSNAGGSSGTDGFVPVGDEAGAALTAFIDRRMSGVALSQAEERAAINAGWAVD